MLKCSNVQMFKCSNVQIFKCQMSIRLNFFRSVPPEFLRSFSKSKVLMPWQVGCSLSSSKLLLHLFDEIKTIFARYFFSHNAIIYLIYKHVYNFIALLNSIAALYIFSSLWTSTLKDVIKSCDMTILVKDNKLHKP